LGVELTKQHKVLLGVLGLGVAAVIGDRVLLSGGVTAPATAEARPASEVVKPAEASEPVQHGTVLADRLATAASQLRADASADAQLDSMFGATATTAASTRQAAIVEAETREKTPEQFQFLKLSTVMLNPRPMAWITGEKLELNDEVRVGEGADRHSVKLLAVKGPDRKTGELGSVTVLVDGEHRVELVIDRR
jgi:hypothetical protein